MIKNRTVGFTFGNSESTIYVYLSTVSQRSVASVGPRMNIPSANSPPTSTPRIGRPNEKPERLWSIFDTQRDLFE